nr:Ig-like domain repeat protein [Methanobrevibacter sp. TMH8]
MTFTNCTFRDNHGTNNGGAIYSGGGTVNINNSTFINNTSERSGGAVYFFIGSVFNSNFINNSASIDSGAIHSINEIFVDNSTFAGNNASTAGAISLTRGNINNSIFDNNSADGVGAVYLKGVDAIIFNSTFTNNKAKNSTAGAVGMTGTNNTLINCTFHNSNAYTAGGAVALGGINHSIINCTFNDNHAESGGAIRSSAGADSNIIIDGSTFINNSATLGAAICAYGTVTIINNNIMDNVGDGIYSEGNSIINNNEIIDNNGKGVFNDGNATLNDNIITGNTGGNVVNNGDLSGLGNTIDYQTNLTIINTIVSANRVTTIVKAIDHLGNVIVGATINFYVNGKLVGSAITNNEGIAQFTYTANAGLQNIVAFMSEFNGTNDLATTTIHLAANTSTSVNVVLEKGTVITVSALIINEGRKTNIKVTLKDINGNILKNKKISLKINGKTYTAITNNNGIAVFKIAGLKGGKHTLIAKFAGDNNYKSSTTKAVQKVISKSNLGIVSIKELSNKRLSTCKVTIANKGSLKSKATVLSLYHMRKGVKIKTKYIKIKSIAPGKKISIIVSYFPDKANHRYCIAHFQVDPKNKNKEIILANNKKSISLKH